MIRKKENAQLTKSSSAKIFEQKLARHKIRFAIKNNELVIGRSRGNRFTLIFFIAIPFAACLGVFGFSYYFGLNIWDDFGRKAFAFGLFFLATSVGSAVRQFSLKRSNQKTVILSEGKVTVEDKQSRYEIHSKQIDFIGYSSGNSVDGLAGGSLYLVELSNKKHELLAIADEKIEYVENDLKWMSIFFSEFLEPQYVPRQLFSYEL